MFLTDCLRRAAIAFVMISAITLLSLSLAVFRTAGVLQSDVLTLDLSEECEDRVLRSVAGLKQVRYACHMQHLPYQCSHWLLVSLTTCISPKKYCNHALFGVALFSVISVKVKEVFT